MEMKSAPREDTSEMEEKLKNLPPPHLRSLKLCNLPGIVEGQHGCSDLCPSPPETGNYENKKSAVHSSQLT